MVQIFDDAQNTTTRSIGCLTSLGLGCWRLPSVGLRGGGKNLLQWFVYTGKYRVEQPSHCSSSTAPEGGYVSGSNSACNVVCHPITANLH